MRRSTQRLVLLAMVLLLVLPSVTAAAVPPVPPDRPASFYGRVRISTANVPANSVIFVNTGDLELAHVTVIQDSTYGSVYALNVPADNQNTALVDGGKPGDILTFYIQPPSAPRMRAARTAVWTRGANVQVDLNFGGFSVYLPLVTNRHFR